MTSTGLRISVILCTRNPKIPILRDVLHALAKQTLPPEQWEMIAVDNASDVPLQTLTSLPWPSHTQFVREERLGLTAARVCGIRASRAQLLMFLDDDNVLDPDYLAEALQIESEWPQLGTWGGSIAPRWQAQPPEWTRRYWNWLAIREADADRWSNVPFEAAAHPYGAGMCVRRTVALRYVDEISRSALRSKLDRAGDSLFGGGDADLNFTAHRLGLGTGVFQRLRMEHWMPQERLTEDYLLRLVEDMTCSHHLLCYAQGRRPTLPSRSQQLLQSYQRLFIDRRARRFDQARSRGLKRSLEMIAQLEATGTDSPQSPVATEPSGRSLETI